MENKLNDLEITEKNIKKIEQGIEKLKEKRLQEKRKIREITQKERNQRIMLHGINAEAVFGEKTNEEMLIILFQMLDKLERYGNNDYKEIPYFRKKSGLDELGGTHKKQLELLIKVEEKAKSEGKSFE